MPFLSENLLLVAAGSEALWADIVAGVLILIIVIVETIYILRQSRGPDDGEGGVREPSRPRPRGPAPGRQLKQPP